MAFSVYGFFKVGLPTATFSNSLFAPIPWWHALIAFATMLGRAIVATLAFCVLVVYSDPTDATFSAPFTDVSASGDRIIEGWQAGGNAMINENFVRLTPDRQSKLGWMWSQNPIDSAEVVAELKFRISGQGAKLFGDGIGLWITQHARRLDGSLHGMSEEFVGVGIILDTFKNHETADQHRDALILVNDGNKDTAEMMEVPVGCDANFRYHEGRADFSVTDAARIRVGIKGSKLTLEIDANNSGTFTECATVANLNLPPGWLKTARFGLTATTGGLADNHDVLGLQVYPTVAEAQQAELEAEELRAKKETGAPAPINSARFNQLSKDIEALSEESDTVRHHLEHQLTAINDGLKITIAKLQDQEKRAVERIAELEKRMEDVMEDHVEERLEALEEEMRGSMDQRLTSRVGNLERRVDDKISGAVEKGVLRTGAGGWKLPFAILVVVLAVVGLALYRWYEKMRKTHLL